MWINQTDNKTFKVLMGEKWDPRQPKGETVIVNRSFKGNTSIEMEDVWAMLSSKKSTDGSGGAPAAVAKYQPTRESSELNSEWTVSPALLQGQHNSAMFVR